MRPLCILLLLALPLVAAPVPKALKKPPTADGVWEWVEFNGNDGKMKYDIPKPSYWRIEGDRMSRSRPSVEAATGADLQNFFGVLDESQPHLRTFDNGGTKYSAAAELDGDTLRWCYATDTTKTVTECKPAEGVYYYVFQRVKVK